MPAAYTYHDAYLAKFCDEALETRALADVNLLVAGRTLSADWLERIARLQAYILVCLDRQADVNDLFTAKLKTYRDEMEISLPQAIADADETASQISRPYNLTVLRS